MGFSLLSWNVEKFNGNDHQLNIVLHHFDTFKPDVFGIFEVENINIIDLMLNKLPDYNYHLTQGAQNKEILVGVRKDKFAHSIFTQKREFQAYNPRLRPGAFLSLVLDDTFYNILFLHTDSGTEARDFGNRYEMFEKIWSLKSALDKLSGDDADGKLIVLGDLNTMGLKYPRQRKKDITVTEPGEIDALKAEADRHGMEVLVKQFDTTFNNKTLESNLDHIVASKSIDFNDLGARPDGVPFRVRVEGWHQLNGAERDTFIDTVSDHCLLYCEIK